MSLDKIKSKSYGGSSLFTKVRFWFVLFVHFSLRLTGHSRQFTSCDALFPVVQTACMLGIITVRVHVSTLEH